MAETNGFDPVADFLKKRGNMLTHTVSMMMLSGLLGMNLWGDQLGIATKGYVEQRLTQATTQVTQNTDKLNRILELQIAQQIEKLLRWRCMNQGNFTFDDQLRELERDYREISGNTYPRPNCDFLTGQ